MVLTQYNSNQLWSVVDFFFLAESGKFPISRFLFQASWTVNYYRILKDLIILDGLLKGATFCLKMRNSNKQQDNFWHTNFVMALEISFKGNIKKESML